MCLTVDHRMDWQPTRQGREIPPGGPKTSRQQPGLLGAENRARAPSRDLRQVAGTPTATLDDHNHGRASQGQWGTVGDSGLRTFTPSAKPGTWLSLE